MAAPLVAAYGFQNNLRAMHASYEDHELSGDSDSQSTQSLIATDRSGNSSMSERYSSPPVLKVVTSIVKSSSAVMVSQARPQPSPYAQIVEDLSRHAVGPGSRPTAVGGSYDVYTGWWLNEEKVALKLHRALNSSAKGRQLFIEEMNQWRRLQHENVLPLYGMLHHGDQVYSISPWVNGGKASVYLPRNLKLSKLSLFRQIAEGMEYLHSFGVVHGALRGANIYVSSTGLACITDFGLSNILNELARDAQMPVIPALPRWLAPEVISPAIAGRKTTLLTTETDAWSFGMTMLELATAAPPYSNIPREIIVCQALVQGQLPLRPAIWAETPALDDALWHLMLQCWARNAEARPSMLELKSVLQRLERSTKHSSREKPGQSIGPPEPHVLQEDQVPEPVAPEPPVHYPEYEEKLDRALRHSTQSDAFSLSRLSLASFDSSTTVTSVESSLGFSSIAPAPAPPPAKTSSCILPVLTSPVSEKSALNLPLPGISEADEPPVPSSTRPRLVARSTIPALVPRLRIPVSRSSAPPSGSPPSPPKSAMRSSASSTGSSTGSWLARVESAQSPGSSASAFSPTVPEPFWSPTTPDTPPSSAEPSRKRSLFNLKRTKTIDIDPHPVFGKPLSQSLEYAGMSIPVVFGHRVTFAALPIVVTKCGFWLKQHGLHKVGLFHRKEGRPAAMKRLQEIYDTGPQYGKHLNMKGDFSVYDVAGVLRKYLLDLPEPVIPLDVYSRFVAVLDNRTEQEAIVACSKLLDDMPINNAELLLYMLDFQATFVINTKTNLMAVTDVVDVFHSALLYHPDRFWLDGEEQRCRNVLAFMIQRFDFLMSERRTARNRT